MQQIGLERSAVADIDTETLAEDLSSPRAKLVYLYLATGRGGSVEELVEGLGMTRLDLFTVLDSLVKHGHVRRDGETYSIA